MSSGSFGIPPSGGGLFGAQTTRPPAPSGGLFGGGAQTQTAPGPASGGGLFGGQTAASNPGGMSFGGGTSSTQATSTLFGGGTGGQFSGTSGLFGQTAGASTGGLFGGSGSTATFGAAGGSAQRPGGLWGGTSAPGQPLENKHTHRELYLGPPFEVPGAPAGLFGAGGAQPTAKASSTRIENLLHSEQAGHAANAGLVRGLKQGQSKEALDEQLQKELQKFRPLYEHSTSSIEFMLSDPGFSAAIANKQVCSLPDHTKQLVADIDRLLRLSAESIRELKKTAEDVKTGIRDKLEDAATLKLIKLKAINCSLIDLKQKIWVAKNFVDFTLFSRNELNEFFEADRSQKRSFISVPAQNVARVAGMLKTYSRLLTDSIGELLQIVRSKEESQQVLRQFGEIIDSLLSLICDVEAMNRQVKLAVSHVKHAFGISSLRHPHAAAPNKMQLEDLNSASHSLNELGKIMF